MVPRAISLQGAIAHDLIPIIDFQTQGYKPPLLSSDHSYCNVLVYKYRFNLSLSLCLPQLTTHVIEKLKDSSEIRTHEITLTTALNQRSRPLGHAILKLKRRKINI